MEKTKWRELTSIGVSDKVIAGVDQRGTAKSAAKRRVLVVDPSVDTDEIVVRTYMCAILRIFTYIPILIPFPMFPSAWSLSTPCKKVELKIVCKCHLKRTNGHDVS